MAGNYPDYADLGTNIKTSFNLDVQKLNDIDVTSDSFKELLRRLYRDLMIMENSLNDKVGGYYPKTEFVNGHKFFSTSQTTVGTTNGAGNFTIDISTIVPGPYLGQSYTIGTTIFTVTMQVAPWTLTVSPGGVGTGTLNLTTNVLNIVGANPTTTIYANNTNFNNSTTNPMTNRQEFVKVYDFGELLNNAIKRMPHGITFDANTTFTSITATATSPTTLEALPIPFVTPVGLNNAIALNVTATNIEITTGADYSRFTRCVVILKWLKN